MAFYKMGVCPGRGVKNPNSFFLPITTAQLNANYSTGDYSVVVTGAYPALWFTARAGDRILFGPSTNTQNMGISEAQVIATVAVNTITITGELDFNYNTGDPISIIGSALPEGWQTDDSEGDYVFHGVYTVNSVKNHSPYDLYNHCLDITYVVVDSTLYQVLGNVLIPDSTYLIGMDYKMTNPSTNTIKLILHDGTSNIITSAALDSTTWAAITATGVSGAMGVLGSATLSLICSAQGGPPDPRLYAGSFHICHAIDTDDYASGIYTFDDYPDLGSVNFEEISPVAIVQLFDDSIYTYNRTGLITRRPLFRFNSRFSNVSTAFLQQLRILEAWQNRGNWLVFKHEDTALRAQGVPPVMIGRMDLSPRKDKELWDLSKVSFDFSFTEME